MRIRPRRFSVKHPAGFEHEFRCAYVPDYAPSRVTLYSSGALYVAENRAIDFDLSDCDIRMDLCALSNDQLVLGGNRAMEIPTHSKGS